ncbi:MAG: hypothetical protein ACOCQQ_00170 [Candidatus Nanoarchaeia archaeon]
MKKLFLAMLLVLVVSLTACSLYESVYVNSANTTSEDVNDSTSFLDSLVENETESVDNQSQSQNNTSDDAVTVEMTEVTDDNDSIDDDPLFASVTVREGDLVSLDNFSAVDPDGDEVSYSYEDPFNDVGLWQTNEGDAGKYLVTITATDGMLQTNEEVQIVVLPSNKGPVIECKDSYEFAEGDFIELPCTIYDKEGDEFTYEVSGFMTSLTYQTTYDDAGEHLVVITATDGNKVTAKEIMVNITNTNRAPELATESLAPINATELDTVTLDVPVTDPDGDELEITYPEMFSEDGVWVPQQGDAGEYSEEVIVSDGESQIVLPFEMTIEKVNLPPQFEEIPTLYYEEGDFISLPVNITDDEEVVVTYSGFMTGRTYQTTYDDAGTHTVFIEASDGVHTVNQTVTIVIENVNRPPYFIEDEQ